MLILFGEGRLPSLLRRLVRQSVIVIACIAFSPSVHAQQVFATPQAAAEALISAVSSNERKNILAVVGRSAFDILASGDEVADAASRRRLVEGYSQKSEIVMSGDREAVLLTGSTSTPFPIPLIRSRAGWQFDIATGRIELLRARIARNETKALKAIRALVRAQIDYAAIAVAKEGRKRYAQRIISRPGLKDGLYWPASGGDQASPMHNLLESAKVDGYSFGRPRTTYYGYKFKVLFKQGPKARGGSFDYNEQGNMVHGFALIAFPFQYGHSGVMTFMVNHSGVVFQKDLGAYTTRFADREIWFNPDQTWRKVADVGCLK